MYGLPSHLLNPFYSSDV
jgi:hypothetical protein